MAARDRFEIVLTCPKCGNSGTAKVSEDDYPFMSSPDFTFDDMPDGFSVFKRAEIRANNIIKCKCGEKFNA